MWVFSSFRDAYPSWNKSWICSRITSHLNLVCFYALSLLVKVKHSLHWNRGLCSIGTTQNGQGNNVCALNHKKLCKMAMVVFASLNMLSFIKRTDVSKLPCKTLRNFFILHFGSTQCSSKACKDSVRFGSSCCSHEFSYSELFRVVHSETSGCFLCCNETTKWEFNLRTP